MPEGVKLKLQLKVTCNGIFYFVVHETALNDDHDFYVITSG
jgi:hypothetical protein